MGHFSTFKRNIKCGVRENYEIAQEEQRVFIESHVQHIEIIFKIPQNISSEEEYFYFYFIYFFF